MLGDESCPGNQEPGGAGISGQFLQFWEAGAAQGRCVVGPPLSAMANRAVLGGTAGGPRAEPMKGSAHTCLLLSCPLGFAAQPRVVPSQRGSHHAVLSLMSEGRDLKSLCPISV